MPFTATSWMRIHVLWLIAMLLPLSQGSPITSQFVAQSTSSSSSSSLSSSFATASPSYRPDMTKATPTATSDRHLATSSGIPAVTAAPEPPLLQEAGGGGLPANVSSHHYNNSNKVNLKFVQTTYWSCVQWPTTVHCGWHEPILDASSGGGRCQPGSPQRAVGAGVVAGVVGFFLAAA